MDKKYEQVFQDKNWKTDFSKLAEKISSSNLREEFHTLLDEFLNSVDRMINEQQNTLIEIDEKRKRAERRAKELEIQLIQSDKLASVGELAGGVAHEINNPLAAVSGIVQILLASRKKENLSDVTVSRLNKIENQAERISKITNDLLQFSRKPSVTYEPIDVHKCIRETIDLILHQAELKKIEIRKEFSEDIPMIQGSHNQLEQVFLNLLINAVDAMHQGGGTLTVRTQLEEGKHVLIQFEDTGVGISPLTRHRVFDPFFTTKPSGQGVGLGLSVSYSIIKDHGGDMNVDSEEGNGSIFSVKIPTQASYRIKDDTGFPGRSVHSRKTDPNGVSHFHLRRKDRNLPNIEREFLTQLLSIWHQSDLEVMASIDEKKIEEVGMLTGKRLFKIIPEKPKQWNPKEFAQLLGKYIRLPRGVKLNFTSITDDDMTLKFSCCQPDVMKSNPSAACSFTYHFWRAILKSAFPAAELKILGTMAYGSPVCALKFLLSPDEEERETSLSSLDELKESATFLTKEKKG